MKIFGAGMAGLLAANMLRRYEPEVHELQASLPYNHGALLRFRTDAVARATGQPFRKVKVHKAVLWNGRLHDNPTLQMANSYSFKVTGRILARSILDISSVDRWIAPPDFIEKMTKGINITYCSGLSRSWVLGRSLFTEPYISTIPMSFLMDMVEWEGKPIFLYDSIVSITVKIIDPMVDIYQTIYSANINEPGWYRASIIGSYLILEYMTDNLWNDVAFSEMDKADIEHAAIKDTEGALALFGIKHSEIGTINAKFQKFGKLKPIDDTQRRSFITGMTQQYGIYSLGRFATWRQILLDDVVKDVEIIDSFIQDKTEYTRHLRSVPG
jgi:hypothetical protein